MIRNQERLIQILNAIVFLLVFSCQEEELPVLPDLPVEIRYLSLTHNSSSNTIIANGVNQVYFTVTAFDADQNKTNVTPATYNKIKLEVNGTNELTYPYVFKTTEAGSYTFRIKGLSSDSDMTGLIEIKAIQDNQYEAVTLPIVFHYVSSGISDFQRTSIQKKLSFAVEEVNKAFMNLMGSKDPNAANPNVTFTLAEEDPQGNPLEFQGLNEIYSTEKSFGTYNNSTIDGLVWNGNFWTPKKYINVWIVPLDDNYSWAYFPEFNSSGSFPSRTYGVVYNKNHINEPMTLAHELGHMLNLRHVFDDSCTDPDLCKDTWAYKRNFTDTETRWYLSKKTCDEQNFTSNNYMDYYPSQNTTFSMEQVVRMQFTLKNCPFLPTEKNRTNGKTDLTPYSNSGMKRESDFPHRII